MALYELLCRHIEENDVPPPVAKERVLSAALELLEMILSALRNPDLDDRECFMRIEQIVQAYEEFGIDCDGRHDFG